MFILDSEQLWVLDFVPGEVNSEVEKVLHTLHSLPLSLPLRKYAFFLIHFKASALSLMHADR